MEAKELTLPFYELTLVEGRKRSMFKRDVGAVMVESDGLAWTFSGKPRRKAYRDICAIRLQMTHGGRGAAGLCVIDFADGSRLRVSSADRRGHADSEGALRYRLFVHDLHRRLMAAGAGSVQFKGGASTESQTLGAVLIVLVLLVFVVAPFFGFIVVGNPKLLLLMAGAVTFGIPLLVVTFRNRPIDYTPDQIPSQLLP